MVFKYIMHKTSVIVFIVSARLGAKSFPDNQDVTETSRAKNYTLAGFLQIKYTIIKWTLKI